MTPQTITSVIGKDKCAQEAEPAVIVAANILRQIIQIKFAANLQQTLTMQIRFAENDNKPYLHGKRLRKTQLL